MVTAGVAALVMILIDHVRARSIAPDVMSLSPGGAIALASGHVFAVTVALVLGALAWAAGSAVGRWVRWRPVASVIAPATVLAIPLAPLLFAAGVQLASGPWISEQGFAPLVRIGPLVGGVAALPFLAAIVSYGLGAVAWKRRALASLLLVAFGTMVVADHRVFAGLYPEFHMLAYGASAAAVLVGLRVAVGETPSWSARRRTHVIAALVAVLLCASPFVWFGASSKVRNEILLYSPTARDFIRVAMPQRKSTPLRAALEDLDVSEGSLERADAEAPRGLISGAEEMNVLFVVVDALRADAVPPVRPAEGTKFTDPGDTPFLDEWLGHTYRFTRCYTAATATRMAMPALFRSIEVSDDPVKHGVPAGQRFEALGLTPVAVVLDWFISGKWPAAGALLDGFEDVVVYEQSDNDQVIDHTRRLLSQVKDRRFFAWVHLFEVHDPGYDGKLLASSDGSRVERYRRSLRYLDQDFARLIGLLDEFGVRQNTIVVFVADHGEGLGDHGVQLHGPNLFEEDVHVPFAIAIPGREGTVIDSLVGTIDVMPTVIDLLGAPRDANDRGRSLVPLMAGHDDPEPRAYYFQNGEADTFGLIVGTDKLFWEPRTDLIFRSDLVADPKEREYLYDPEGELDRSLMRQLIQFNPALVKDELEDEETYGLVEQRLDEVDPESPGAALPFLLRLAALHPNDETLRTSVRIFEGNEDPRVRLLVLRTMAQARPKRFEKLVTNWIDELADSPTELEVVSAMARQGQPAVAGKRVVERMEHWVEHGEPTDWEPYLLLVKPWSKTPKFFVGVFASMLQSIDSSGASVPPRITELVLDNVASMRKGSEGETSDIARLCRDLLDDRDARVRAGALRAVAGLGDETALATVKVKLDDARENPRVRREAAAALVSLVGEDAIEDLIRVAEDPLLTAVVLRQLKRLGDPSVLPFLQDLRKKHASGWIRIEVDRLIKELQGKQGKRGKRGTRG
jgi:hypothetical protein